MDFFRGWLEKPRLSRTSKNTNPRNEHDNCMANLTQILKLDQKKICN
jgi:hypothetical protein